MYENTLKWFISACVCVLFFKLEIALIKFHNNIFLNNYVLPTLSEKKNLIAVVTLGFRLYLRRWIQILRKIHSWQPYIVWLFSGSVGIRGGGGVTWYSSDCLIWLGLLSGCRVTLCAASPRPATPPYKAPGAALYPSPPAPPVPRGYSLPFCQSTPNRRGKCRAQSTLVSHCPARLTRPSVNHATLLTPSPLTCSVVCTWAIFIHEKSGIALYGFICLDFVNGTLCQNLYGCRHICFK